MANRLLQSKCTHLVDRRNDVPRKMPAPLSVVLSNVLYSNCRNWFERSRLARQSQAAKAGEVALERLRERKAEERRKAAAAAEMQQAMVMEEERAREEERQLRAEQRRLRLETSFFARPLAH